MKWLIGFFVLGCTVVWSYPGSPNLTWLVGTVIALCAVFWRYQRLCIAAVLCFSLGGLWSCITASHIMSQQLPSDLEGQFLELEGVVTKVKKLEASLELDFQVLKVSLSGSWRLPAKIRLYASHLNPVPTAGDQWSFQTKLKKPRNFANPGSYDKERYFFSHRIVAEGFITPKSSSKLIAKASSISLRDRMIEEWIPRIRSFNFSPIIQALCLGDTSKISSDQWGILRKTGTAHLVAVSGLHIGLIFGLGLFLGRIFIRFIGSKTPMKLSFILGLSLASTYAYLSGFSVSCQRALLMCMLMVITYQVRHHISLWSCLYLALGMIVLWDPLVCLNIGLWLSFGSVGSLLITLKYYTGATTKIRQWCRAQWGIQFGLAPLSLAFFDEISIVAPLANLIAIPWVSVITVPLCVAALLFSCISQTFSQFCLKVCNKSLEWLWQWLELVASIPKASLTFPHYSIYVYLGLSLGGLLMLLPHKFPSRYLAFIFSIPLFFPQALIPENQARISLLDVGQGLAIVVETRHHNLIFDTGPKLGRYSDAGDRVIIPFLKSKGISEIDSLILSHWDSDHSGGLLTLLKSIQVQTIITNNPAYENTRNLSFCRSGRSWNWDGVLFEFLHPTANFLAKDNDRSCVLKISTGDQAVLVSGDIEVKAEHFMLKHVKERLHSTLLVVPHHGSKTSSSLEFLEAVRPKIALVSSGYRNRFSHPHIVVQQRYQHLAIPLYDTAYEGLIYFNLGEESITLHRHRREHATLYSPYK